MDFVTTAVKVIDEEKRLLECCWEPNPDRYEWKDLDGRRLLYDRFDNSYIPWEVFKSAVARRIYPNSSEDDENRFGEL
jgi:hypothetical protein